MKKALILLAALALLWGIQGDLQTAYAHGGAYRGPAGEVPPGQRDPKDPQPPPDGGTTPNGPGNGTPTGPQGPGSGGDGGDTPDSPPAPQPNPDSPVGPGSGGPVVSPGQRPRGGPPPMGFENWLFWWAYNKDDILNLKHRLKSREERTTTEGGGHFFGEGSGGRKVESATPAQIREKIVPALEQVIKNRQIHPDIRGGALIALARAEPNRKYLRLFIDAASADNGEDKVVQESGIIALGILQIRDAEVRQFLIGLVENRDYPIRGRCFAMLALGLLKDRHPDTLRTLEARLTAKEVHLDVPVCALLAIGLIGDAKSVPKLIRWLETGRIGRDKIGDLEKAWVVSALGKIGHPDALNAISRVLREKGRYAQRSAAIAIGQIAPQTEGKEQMSYAKILAGFHKNAGDVTAKNFALISLGRIGGDANATEEVRTKVKDYLKKQFREVNRTTERPFVALSMGLLGLEAKSPGLREELAAVIRPALTARKGDKVALGALAVSLGMLKDTDSIPMLIDCLKDRGLDRKLRGAAAVSLGLIGDGKAREAILATLREREDRRLRVDTAVAAGLLGSSDAVPLLVEVLNDKKASQFVLGSVALALGQIGDHGAIDPMIAILEAHKTNGTYPDLTRALVSVALGQLADRRDIRVLARLSKDINYRASVSALDEILTIL